MNARQRVWNRLYDELFEFERPSTRGERAFGLVFELLVCSWTLLFVWEWVALLPRLSAVVLPLGVANYVDVSALFATAPAYSTVTLLTLALVCGLFRVRFAYLVAVSLFHVMYVARYSLGEISHGSHFVGMALLALGLARDLFHGDAHKVGRFAFGWLFFVYGLSYASAGVCKLVATGLGWPSGSHLTLWIGERSIDVLSTWGSYTPNAFQVLALEYPIIGTAALTFGLLAELAAPLMWFRRLRPWVLSALIVMHLGVELSLDIFFGHNIYLLVLLAYPWARGFDLLLSWAHPRATLRPS